MCELVGALEHSIQFGKGRLVEEEENWSISDSSERMKCVPQNNVDGVLDINVRCPRVDLCVRCQRESGMVLRYPWKVGGDSMPIGMSTIPSEVF